jgi:hypothetical protein
LSIPKYKHKLKRYYYKNFIPVDGVVVALTVGERTCKVRAERYGGRVRRRGGPNSDGSDATEDGIQT